MNSIERFSQGLGIAALGMGWLATSAVAATPGALSQQVPLPTAHEAADDSLKQDRPEGEGISQAADILQQAAEQANQATLLSQTAASAADWDGVMVRWLEAIALAQSIPPESPARIFAQRQLRSYVQGLIAAQRENEQASPFGFPSLGSDLFDVQLAGYLSYVATVGTPDILIVGSSRALQGIDPQVLQQTLAGQGYPDLKVYNFSVNGATAQVVNFVLSELLPTLPAVIVWGDGSRAFNEGRRDRTWESIMASAGYRAVRAGENPAAGLGGEAAEPAADADDIFSRLRAANAVTSRSGLPELTGNVDALGFAAVSDRFSPQAYYQQFPKVSGRYDGAYEGFALNGAQRDALGGLADFVAAQDSQLFFVNLPLSDSYLDSARQRYEGQFQQFLQAQSAAHGFEVIDLLTQWQGRVELFADPSHINQAGAAAIAVQLARHPDVLAAIRRQGEGVGDGE
ncbi:MAG: hypothetical protein WBB01_12855 [Phormidesmis sp.]